MFTRVVLVLLSLVLAVAPVVWAAFPTTAVLDNMNRTENPISNGGNWTNSILALDNTIQTNGTTAVLGTAGGAFGSAYWSAATFGPDSEVYMTVTTLPGTGEVVEVWLNIRDGDGAAPDGYFLDVAKTAGSADWSIWTSVDGTQAQIAGPTTSSLSINDQIGLERIGTTLTGYKNGVAVLSVVDSNAGIPSTGNIGLVIQQTTAAVDNFGGGTITAGASTNASSRMLRGVGR